MNALALFPVFLVGLLGSVHCAGMCGGIVGVLSMARRGTPVAAGRVRGGARVFALPLRSVGAPAAHDLAVNGAANAAVNMAAKTAANTAASAAAHVAAYNAGRIASYAGAGALAGGAAGGVAAFTGLPALQAGAYLAANLMLAALGLYLMGAWRGLARLEQLGQGLWRHVAPHLSRIGPLDTPARMFAAGALWGWLPCGMVYSVLVTAMLSGSALGGASVMLAFGLGTLPMLAAIGLAGVKLRTLLQLRRVRLACGLLVLGFGLLGLWRLAAGLPPSWIDAFCLTRGAGA